MAFMYEIDGKIFRFDDDFHFWYVTGERPDPKLKKEIEEGQGEDNEARLVYSRARGVEGGSHFARMKSWRR